MAAAGVGVIAAAADVSVEAGESVVLSIKMVVNRTISR